MTETNPKLDKIRKLLALAENDGATPAEAEAFTAKAAQLMATYGIDRAMLGDLQPGTDRPGDRKITIHAPYDVDKAYLLAAVTQALNVHHVRFAQYAGGTKVLIFHMFGYESDLDRAEILYTSLLVQMANAVAATPVPEYDNARAFRKSFMTGYTHTIFRRLLDLEARAAADYDAQHAGTGRGTELVLVDRKAAVALAVKTAYPKTSKVAARRLRGTGAAAGRDAGNRADLGQARMGGNSSRALAS